MEINIQQICSIRVYKKAIVTRFTYRPERKFLFFFTLKEGFLDAFDVGVPLYTKEQVLSMFSNIYIENNIVCENPHIRFRMSNNTYHDKYFDTFSDLSNWLDELRLKLPLTEVEN